MEVMKRHDLEIGELKMLRWKLMGMITLGGVVAGLVAFAVQLALK